MDMPAHDPIKTSQTLNDAHTLALFRFLGDEVGDVSDKQREAKKQKFDPLEVEERDL